MEKVYLVIREKGIHTDGFSYYESEEMILGARGTQEEASAFLKKAGKHFHPEEDPIRGTYDFDTKNEVSLIYKIDEALEDTFIVKCMTIGKDGDLI